MGEANAWPAGIRLPDIHYNTHGGKMSAPNGENDVLYELKIEVEAELTLAEASHPEEVVVLPVTDWLVDPTDVEREEIGLRGLLASGAAPGGPGRGGGQRERRRDTVSPPCGPC
ncbi:hypothetical protein [Nonomuraea sp. bgisy101]|uniref:hypothetical protein n=1 Tax=Nonomuraea sp. bgisy101 TaxID=3413784 RepID=UPI003D75C4F5